MKTTAGSICITAAELVSTGRAVTHGNMYVNFKNIALLWTAILQAKPMPAPIDALDVANMLEALKIARRYSGTFNVDDYIDAAGYAGCAGEIAAKQQQ